MAGVRGMDARVKDAPASARTLRDAPALIERVWPAQKISVEARREFDAHGAQTLTPLGSYWKGRKRLVYVRACVLGALLPATEDPERDLEIFEKLMAMDDDAFFHRIPKWSAAEVATLAIEAKALTEQDLGLYFEPSRTAKGLSLVEAWAAKRISWKKDVAEGDAKRLMRAALGRLSYQERVERGLRPEELDPSAYEEIWDEVNEHLGTSAHSHEELVEQLGRMRFGHRPMVADTFCGAGSIPFEAARLGCDVYASDLNPIACMLTWGALHLIGGGERLKDRLEAAQSAVADAVDKRITELGIEHDAEGNRAKAYLYCVEVRCPRTGWLVPLMPSFVISRIKKTVARLVPNHTAKRFDIAVDTNVSDETLAAARKGSFQGQSVVYELDGEVHSTPLSDTKLRGDGSKGKGTNNLRLWDRTDISPRPDDILGERLYCIQWIKKETIGKFRQETYFAAPTEADLEREARVRENVLANLTAWQAEGHVPDMKIEPGDKTDEPIRTRGWTHWHHLFCPRQLLLHGLVAEEISKVEDEELRGCLYFDRAFLANFSSKLSQWLPGSPGIPGRAAAADQVKGTFYNQALNPFYNYGCRAWSMSRLGGEDSYRYYRIDTSANIATSPAHSIDCNADIFITDPPYADAVNYHEITEFFIAWLRRNPPEPFKDWVWDSRRPLAIKGDGEEFRQKMVAAYKAMADHMPDNGLQIVMFTHKDAGVWGDLVQIVWGAGLRVMAAWYVATETTSDTKKGGYVTGTVTLVLRKRLTAESGYKDEIVQEVKAEVARQIDTMVGLNQSLKGHGRVDNLFENSDLQMAGYAAAMRVLTGYARIDGVDMAKEAVRPRRQGETGLVDEIIAFAVQVANEHLVPDGMPPKAWGRLTGSERFFYRMVDMEAVGLRKLDDYQNFAKAFRVERSDQLMGDLQPEKARLKTAREFGKSGFEGNEFGATASRALLYAIYEIEQEVDEEIVLSHLSDLVPGRLEAESRDHLLALTHYIAEKRQGVDEAESRAARILYGLIRNERVGGR